MMRNRSAMWLSGVATVALASVAMIWVAGCGGREEQTTADREMRHVVYTTFHPTTYFAERIAGDAVEVVNPCPGDADPAYWMPDAATITAYQDADLVIINGANFEKWVKKVSLPMSRVIDVSEPLKDEFITLEHAVTHSHGPGGAHTHEGIDGHTWVDPMNARVQAETIAAALTRTYPGQADRFAAGLKELTADLDALDARLKAVSGKIGDQALVANHPAWNYPARRYGWKVRTFLLDPEEMPNDDTMAAIRAYVDETGARYILWEAEPAAAVAKRFADDLGLTGIVYSPGEAFSDEELAAGENYLTVMNENIDRLEEAFGG